MVKDWRIDGGQTTCEEAIEIIDGKSIDVFYMFVKYKDADAETILNFVVKSLLPKGFIIKQS